MILILCKYQKKSMKNFKFIYLLLAVVGAITFASCEHKYADWTPGEPDKGLGVYFPSTQGFKVAATDTSVDIVVARVKIDAFPLFICTTALVCRAGIARNNLYTQVVCRSRRQCRLEQADK